jgi:hypothetical protein
MSPHQTYTRIPLQTGSELRIRNTGEISVANPTLETALSADTADAVLEYRFDAHTGEHVIRLVEPAVCRTQAKASDTAPRKRKNPAA